MKTLDTLSLVAPCGINCRVCAAFLREKNHCPGCRAPDAGKPVTRWRCKIKACPSFREGRWKFCFQCAAFPCDVLKQLDKRYRTRYHTSIIDNLKAIGAAGIRKFVAAEKCRWTCPGCGGTICIHKGRCHDCGK